MSYLDLFDFSAVRAIAFDCYGTIVHIRQPKKPYRTLLEKLQKKGIEPPADLPRRLMTAKGGLFEVALDIGCYDYDDLVEVAFQIQCECESVTGDFAAADCIANLQYKGWPVGVCSNLVQPYAKPVRERYPHLDGYVWSFEVGAIKPEPAIFARLCEALNCEPGEVLFIGDSVRNDVTGARAFGMQALLYDPCGKVPGSISCLSEFGDQIPNKEG